MTTKNVPLKFPKTIEGVEIKSVDMRRPDGLDYLQAQKKETLYEENVTMCAGLCSMTLANFLKFDLVDINNIVREYRGFLDPESEKKQTS